MMLTSPGFNRDKAFILQKKYLLHEEEARRLWGEEAINEFNAKINSLSSREQNAVAENMEELFLELGKIRFEEPDSLVAQAAMDKMYQFFNKNFGYHYSLEAFAGLGQLYVKDERFLKNIDQYGEGLSVFLSRSMKIYAENQ